jgi:predicted kinase
MTPDGRVVIVTGPPGAGKSTVARALAETAGEPGGVHVHGDDFMTYIRKGFIAPHVTASLNQNVILSRALAAAAFAYAGGGYLTVLDWVVGPWFLDEYRAEAARTGLPLDYVVLRPTQEAATARSRDRTANPIADYAYLRPLYEQLADLGGLETHAVDTTAMSRDETVAAVRSGVEQGRFRLV